jgi:hypothetical protein
MVEFMQQYGTEAKAYRALYRARWPHGLRCPACDDRRRSRFRRGRQVYYPCRACRHQTPLLSGTIFEATQLPLRTGRLAIHLLTATKTTMAALERMRHRGVNYKAAWRIKHKVMQAMAAREAPRQLSGFVQIDDLSPLFGTSVPFLGHQSPFWDAYLGGERNGGKPGRGSENKQAFLTSVPSLGSRWRPTQTWSIRPSRSLSRCAPSTMLRSPTGPNTGWRRRPKPSATAWAPSAASPPPTMRTP